jgi:hypothetical protein
MKPDAARANPLWAVTSYFNPASYRRRRENYRVFRDRLKLPLAAIELSFNGRFELGPRDAEILIQIHGRDVMWQKERLLNLLVRALPAHCTKVALLDCDVVFARPNWAEALSLRLEASPIVQPFSTVHYTPPDVSWNSFRGTSSDATRPGVCHLIEQGRSLQAVFGHFTGRGPGTPSPGHALAARRELLQSHGMYDAAIVGGGDTLILAAPFGANDNLIERHVMNHDYAAHYRNWAERLHRSVGGEVGCVQGDLVHLWHGSIDDRRSPQRYHELRTFDYNPYEDIAVDASGCWRWNSSKPRMHAYLRDYFVSRKEDGRDTATCLSPPSELRRAA